MEKNNNAKHNDRNQIVEVLSKISEQNKQVLKKKIFERLMTMNDGVIAIILTIMALEIHVPASSADYSTFLMDIGIYIVSFFIVANFWYDMNSIFSNTESITHFQVILNLLFLVSLSLFPVLTKWAMFDLNKFAVMSYGVIYFITRLLLYIMFYITKKEEVMSKGVSHIGKIIDKMVKARIITLIVMNFALIVIANFNSLIGMILYISLPICSFMWPNKNRM